MAAGITLGVVFLLIGLLPTVPRNRFVGVRTPWTMRSDVAWRGANRLAGPVLLVAGAAVIVVALMAPDVAVWVGGGLALVAATILTVYSWRLWLHDPDRRSLGG